MNHSDIGFILGLFVGFCIPNFWNKIEGKFKGCAIGCSLESIGRLKKIKLRKSSHFQYAKLLGIPKWLAQVEDCLFEGMTEARSKTWPVEFASAIPENVDLEQIRPSFLVIICERALTRFNHSKFPDVESALNRSIKLWKRNDVGSAAFNQKAKIVADIGEFIAMAHCETVSSAAAWTAARVAAAWKKKETPVISAIDSMACTCPGGWKLDGSMLEYEYLADKLLKLLRTAR